jgi:hypothetical protein
MPTPKSLSFQDFFNRYCNVFAIQASLPKFLNYLVTPTNLLTNKYKLPQPYSNTQDFITTLETINFQNKLYQYQNNIELERALTKKFTTSIPALIDETIYNQYKNQLKLEKFKQQNTDLVDFDKEAFPLSYLGLYHSAKSNPWFDTQTSFFGLDHKERLGHLLISGNSDSGKNRVLMNLIGQDIVHGNGAILVSSNHDLCQNILAAIPDFQAENVLYMQPGDSDNAFGIDLFDGKDLDNTLETVLDIFKNIWQGEISDKITYYLEPVLHLILKNQDKANFSDYINIIYNTEFRNNLLQYVTDIKILHFWKNLTKAQMVEMQSTLIKLETINRNRIIREVIENQTKQIKVSDTITKNKVLIVDLSNLAEDNVSSRFVGNLVLKKVAQLSGEYKVKDIFSLYVDEFWNYTGQDLLSKVGFLRKNRVSLTYTQQGTFNKNEDPKLGIVSFGSFMNKLTFNTSDPYSTYNNHAQDMEIDPILKKLPGDTCMFEGNLQSQPTNPFLLEIVQESFLSLQLQPVGYNNPNNFYAKIQKVDLPALEAAKPVKPKPVAVVAPKSIIASPTSKPKTGGSAKTELQAQKLELENKLKYDVSGNLRKTALNATRRKKINEQIKAIDDQIAKL